MSNALPRELERAYDFRLTDPAALDRQADFWLSVGRHARAEQLAHLAAELPLVGGDRDDRRVLR